MIRFLKKSNSSTVRAQEALAQLPALILNPQDVQVVHQASAFKSQLIQHIRQAEKRIVLACLYVQHDEAGQEILSELYQAKAKRPHLDIVVLVDWHRAQRGLIGADKNKNLTNAAWYQAQSQIHQYAIPIYGVPVQTRELLGVLHLKGYIVDDVVLYSGSSINNVYLHQMDKYRYDRYWMIRQADLADAMIDWIKQTLIASHAVHRLDQKPLPNTKQLKPAIRELRTSIKFSDYVLPLHARASHASLSVMPLLGLGRENSLNETVSHLLASASDEIILCTPYFNFPAAITREIKRALERGVNIRIIVGDKTANDFFIPPHEPFKLIACLPYLYEINLRRFLMKHKTMVEQGRLNVYLWQHEQHSYHLKGIWVDQTYTLVTGSNLNPRAYGLDLENGLLLIDPQMQLQEQRQAELQAIFSHTRLVKDYSELETMKQYPPAVKKVLTRLSRVRLDRLAYRVL